MNANRYFIHNDRLYFVETVSGVVTSVTRFEDSRVGEVVDEDDLDVVLSAKIHTWLEETKQEDRRQEEMHYSALSQRRREAQDKVSQVPDEEVS